MTDNNKPEKSSFSQAIERARQWLSETFPGNERVVLYGTGGFLLAILVFVVGIWRTLIIALFVVAGVAIGQYMDGDPKILKWFHRLLTQWRH